MTAFTGPSQTALTAAAARAAHLLVDAPPFIFADTVAAALLGDRADELIADYMLPASLRDAAGNSYAEQVGAAAAERRTPRPPPARTPRVA